MSDNRLTSVSSKLYKCCCDDQQFQFDWFKTHFTSKCKANLFKFLKKENANSEVDGGINAASFAGRWQHRRRVLRGS